MCVCVWKRAKRVVKTTNFEKKNEEKKEEKTCDGKEKKTRYAHLIEPARRGRGRGRGRGRAAGAVAGHRRRVWQCTLIATNVS